MIYSIKEIKKDIDRLFWFEIFREVRNYL